MTRTLLLTAGLLALATPAFAQSGYGQPSAGQYRAERRATAALNQRATVPDDGDEAPDGRPGERPRLDYGEYDRGDAARDDARYDDDRAAYERDLAENRRARADYRRRAAEHRVDLARWRERVAACNDGVRSACAGYEQRYGGYAGGRYAGPDDRDRYAAPAEPGRYAGRYRTAPTIDRDDRYDADDGRTGYDDGYDEPLPGEGPAPYRR